MQHSNEKWYTAKSEKRSIDSNSMSRKLFLCSGCTRMSIKSDIAVSQKAQASSALKWIDCCFSVRAQWSEALMGCSPALSSGSCRQPAGGLKTFCRWCSLWGGGGRMKTPPPPTLLPFLHPSIINHHNFSAVDQIPSCGERKGGLDGWNCLCVCSWVPSSGAKPEGAASVMESVHTPRPQLWSLSFSHFCFPLTSWCAFPFVPLTVWSSASHFCLWSADSWGCRGKACQSTSVCI